MKKTFKFLSCLFVAILCFGQMWAANGDVLFSQDFGSVTALSYRYTSGTVTETYSYSASGTTLSGLVGTGANLFTHFESSIKKGDIAINSSTGGNSVDATGFFHAYSNGDNAGYWSLMRTADFAATAPTALKISIDILWKTIGAGNTNGVQFAIGDGFTGGLTTASPATTTVHSGFGIYSNSNAFIYGYDGSSSISGSNKLSQTEWSTITWIINNTGDVLEYDSPTGSGTTELANDKFDIWVKAKDADNSTYTKIVSAASATTGTKDLQEIYIGNKLNKKHEFSLDNIVVTDLSPATAPDPICPGTLSITGTKAYIEGQKIELTADLSAGNGTITYQWYKGSVAVGNAISGATDAKLEIASCELSDAGDYFCVASKEGCSDAVNASAYAVTVVEAPVKGDVSDLETIDAEYTFVPTEKLTHGYLYYGKKLFSCGGSDLSYGDGALTFSDSRKMALKVAANAHVKVTYTAKSSRNFNIGTTDGGYDIAQTNDGSVEGDYVAGGVVYLSASGDLKVSKIEITYPAPSCAATAPGNISKGTATGGTGTITLTAAGSAKTGDTWYWQNAADGTATDKGSGATKNVSAAGTYYIRSYNAAGTCWSDAKSVTVDAEDLLTAITPSLTYSSSVIVGSTLSPTLTGNAGSGSVTYSLNDVTPAGSLTINGSTGVVTAVTAGGTATVTATIAANGNYAGNTATSGKITVYANPLGTHTLTWTMNVGTSASTTLASSVASTSTYITATQEPNKGSSITTSGSGANSRTIKISGDNVGTSRGENSYVEFAFSIADGYQFTPSAVSVKVANVTTAKKYDLVLSDGSGNKEYTFTSEKTDGSVETASWSSITGLVLTGDCKLRVYGYYASGTDGHRFGTPITITGMVAEYVEPVGSAITTSATNGTIATSVSSKAVTSAESGTQVDIVANPSTGYQFSSWSIYETETPANKITPAASTASTYFTMPAAAVTVEATFSKINYTVTHNASTNGSYTIKVGSADAVSTNTTANYGQTVTLAATPNTGYTLSAWSVTGNTSSNVITVTNNQFTMPAEGVTVNATFEVAPTPSDPENVVILAVYNEQYYAMSTTNESNAFKAIEVEYDGSKVTVNSAEDKAAIQWKKTTNGDNTTFQDANDMYMKSSDGASMSLNKNACNWVWDATGKYYKIPETSRTFFYQSEVFKNFPTDNIGKSGSGYSGKSQVIVIDPANIVITSKVSAELAYNPASNEITYGDAWSAPSLVNPHSVTIASYASDNQAVATVTDAGVIALAGGTGTARITAHFNGDATYLEGDAVYTITINPVPTGTVYLKVTDTEDITDGEYLIVYESTETTGVAFNGALETLDAERNSIAVTIDEGAIVGNTATDAAVFTIDKTAGTLLSKSGYYIGVSSNSNGLKQTDNAETYTNTFSIDGDGNAVISAVFDGSTMKLYYNSSSGDLRFRYYKSSGNQAIQLYKKTPAETIREVVAGTWGTICPQKKVLAPSGASFYTLTYKEMIAGVPNRIFFDEIGAGESLVAGKPYLFIAEGNLMGVEVGDDATSSQDYEGFHGILSSTSGVVNGKYTLSVSAEEEAAYKYYILYQGQIRLCGAGTYNIAVGRAYINMLELGSNYVAPAPGRRRVGMANPQAPQTPTDIDAVTNTGNVMKVIFNDQLLILRDGKLYDTTGRLVGNVE